LLARAQHGRRDSTGCARLPIDEQELFFDTHGADRHAASIARHVTYGSAAIIGGGRERRS
jgi:hypothetical protein